MKTPIRVGLTIVVIGLALVASSLLTPATRSVFGGAAGKSVSETLFFIPGQVSITVSSLNSSARLTVSPLNYSLGAGEPILNVSTIPKDIVTFSLPSRGYYALNFTPERNASLFVAFVVDEGGFPIDLLLAGVFLAAIGLVMVVFLNLVQSGSVRIGRRWRKKRSLH